MTLKARAHGRTTNVTLQSARRCVTACCWPRRRLPRAARCARAGRAGVRRSRACSSKIGIDQRLNQQVPLDLPFRDETGRDVRLGDYFGKRPVVLALALLRVPDALHAGAERPRRRAEDADVRRRARVRRRRRSASTRRKAPGWRRRRSRRTSSATSGRTTAGGWHFLTGTRGVDHAARRGGRLPLRVRRGDPAVRARRRRSRCSRRTGSSRGTSTASSSRRATSASALIEASERADRLGDRQRAAALLPLRPDHREVRRDRDRRGPDRRRSRRCWRFCRSCSSACDGASAAAHTATRRARRVNRT